MRKAHTYSPQTLEAASLLGVLIAQRRRSQRWKVEELAERAGMSPLTLRNIERGVPTVAIGSVFEAATLLGLDLFGSQPDELGDRLSRARDRLALLPSRVRDPETRVDDDF